jgi:hypothetical protein
MASTITKHSGLPAGETGAIDIALRQSYNTPGR